MAIDPQQQRIMGYFIEEAREHLETIDHGLNNFAATVADAEALHEMYRAAHSIKGGAAMLGVESVRLVAYHLEDYFKRIRELSNFTPDQKLVDLLSETYAYLPQLLDQLQKNYEVPPAMAEAAIDAVAMTVEKLAGHFETLLYVEPATTETTSTIDPYTQFGAVVQAVLREMSTFWDYPRTEEATESLLKLCDELQQWGDYLQVEVWNGLVALARQVIANPFNSFEAIAPILSQDLHTACELVMAKRSEEIFPSAELQELLAPPVYSDAEDEQTSNIFSAVPISDEDPDTDLLLHNPYVAESMSDVVEPEIDWHVSEEADTQATESPRIGASEMATLANLFEQKDIDIVTAWEDMESNDTQIAMRAGYGETETPVDRLDEDITDFLQNLPEPELQPVGEAEGDIDSLLAGFAEDTTADLDDILSGIEEMALEPNLSPSADQPTDTDAILDSLLADTVVEELSIPSKDSNALQLEDFFGETPAPAEIAPPDQDDLEILGLGDFFVEESPPETEVSDFFYHQLDDEDDVTYFQVDEVEPSDLAGGGIKEPTLSAIAEEVETIYAVEEPADIDQPEEPAHDALASFFASDIGNVEEEDEWGAKSGELDNIFVSDVGDSTDDIFNTFDSPIHSSGDSALSNLLDEIGTATQYGIDDSNEIDFFADLNLKSLTDSTSPTIASATTSASELDDLSSFFEFGDAPVDADSPLPIDVEDVVMPLADVSADIPDLTDLELLIAAPAIADVSSEFADLEALIDLPPTPVAVLETEQDNFNDLEQMLAVDTPAYSNGNGIMFEATVAPPPAPTVKADSFADLENLLQESFKKEVGAISTRPAPKAIPAKNAQRMASTNVRVDVKYLDSLNNLVGELVVNRNLLDQDQERLQNFMYTLQQRVQQLGDVSQRMRDQYDRSLLETSLMAGRSRNQAFSHMGLDNHSGAQAIAAEFEAIEFDRYNAFHILSQEILELIVRIKESASDIEFVVAETEQVTRELGRIATQVQDDLKQSRMVSFANLADRLPRGVRDRAVKSGKQAELVVLGRETLVDKSILEQLTDPMTHLVNNAVDHGLEPPEVRRQAGKPPQGTIEVRAFHQGNQTVITVRDDGGGINPERVKQKAIEKGLKTPDQVARMTDEEAYELLFLAGFSTRSQADEFAGRGVGLDVVKTCLDDIRGNILIQSEIGKGTQFTIRLPLTLSISKAIFCSVDRAKIAIPLDGFEDMVEIPQSQVILNNIGQTCIPWREFLLPFQPMSNLLQFNRQLGRTYTKQEGEEICVIILRDSDNNYLGLKVDQFLGEHEIVVKQLEGPIPKPPGIAGATVLGDGRVISIANVLELFDIAEGRLRLTTVQQIPVDIDTPEETQPTVLIVDDSITVRELLSMTFSKVGYHVEQARDGQDALEKLRGGLPCDLIFCDIEMPKMDGMELLSRLQKDDVLRQIPMAMLTSRGADKHRQTAIQLGAKAYFTKPYLEEELLTASQRLLKGEVLV